MALPITQNLLQAILDNTVDGIIVIDRHGVIQTYNKAAASLFGYQEEEVLGQQIEMLMPPETAHAHDGYVQSYLAGEGRRIIGVGPREITALRKDGQRVPMELAINELRHGDEVLFIGSLRDIMVRKATEEQFLKTIEELSISKAALDASADSIFLVDPVAMRFIGANKTALDTLGYSQAELLRMGPQDIKPNESEAQLRQLFEKLIRHQAPDELLTDHRRKNGRTLPVEVRLSAMENNDGQHIIVAVARDISDRRKAEKELAYQQALLVEAQQIAKLGSWEWIIASGEIVWTDEVYNIFGHPPQSFEATYDRFLQAIHPDDVEKVTQAVNQALETQESYEVEHRVVQPDGAQRIVQERGRAFYDPDGVPLRMVGSVQDVTELKAQQEKLEYLSNYDILTGLPNRHLLRDRLEHALHRAHRHELLVAVMFIDLDNFKRVNDSLGHHVGDELLKEVAERIQSRLREDDTVARLGGDEFVVILEDLDHVDHAAQIAEDLIQLINKPVNTDSRQLHVGASIGITIYPFDDDNIDSLLQDADVAMYRAKASGKNRYQYFSAEMYDNALERLTLENDLRTALHHDQMQLVYQPQVELSSGRVLGAEALLRWQHPEQGMVSPGKFIPILEESGLIIEVGEWVLRTACEQITSWQAQGLPGIKVAVNTSAKQFLSGIFADTVKQAIRDTGVDVALLEVELTEGTLVEDVETSIHVMQQLHDMGITLAVDDFGTGYSSLSYLQRFPLHTLKIDQSFVRDIAENTDSAAIATTIAMLARNMKLNTIAEGVETADQLAVIRSMGCNEVQGYYFGRPMPADEFRDWFLANTRQGVITTDLD